MLPENALISNIQLALLGIIMVVGVFYIWRGLSRLEDKLDALQQRLAAAPTASPYFSAGSSRLSPFADDPVTEEEAEMADAFMKNVFGNMAFSAMSSGAAAAANGPVIVEEAPSEPPVAAEPPAAPAPPAAPPAQTPIPADDAETDAGNPMSRSKIRKMNADALRDACRAHGLPADGTRAVLTERLLEKLYG